MVKLSEEMIMARTRVSDMAHVKKLNCWGADLTDVSVLRKLRNVEVLSLSVNNITTLADVQDCKNLQELYIRKNSIPDLNEICWLRNLSKLKFLWLEENPAAQVLPEIYRATVIRNLPQLQKLDNIVIAPEEIAEAHRRGVDLVHPLEAIEDPRYGRVRSAAPPPPAQDYRNYVTQQYETPYEQPPPQMEPANQMLDPRRSFCSLQPSQVTNSSSYGPNEGESASIMELRNSGQQTAYERYESSPTRNSSEQQMGYGSSRRSSCQPVSKYSEDDDAVPEYHVGRRYSQQDQTVMMSTSGMRRSSARVTQQSFDEASLRRMSLQDAKVVEDVRNANGDDQIAERSLASSRKASNQDIRNYVAQQYEQTYEQVQQQVDAAQQMIEARRVQDYLANFPKRPKNRNSNILSAVLCLIRELDGPSLEVAEMAIKCRMEELED